MDYLVTVIGLDTGHQINNKGMKKTTIKTLRLTSKWDKVLPTEFKLGPGKEISHNSSLFPAQLTMHMQSRDQVWEKHFWEWWAFLPYHLKPNSFGTRRLNYISSGDRGIQKAAGIHGRQMPVSHSRCLAVTEKRGSSSRKDLVGTYSLTYEYNRLVVARG